MLDTSTGGAADVGTFSRAPLFRGVGPETLSRLAREAAVVSLHGGEYLFSLGETADRLFVVRAGRLRVLVDGHDGPRVVREAGPGDTLGELALLTGSVRSASVQAVRDTELLAVDAAAFDALLAEDPAFSRSLVRELARQLQLSGGLAVPPTRPRVFSLVGLAGDVDTDRLADAVARELGRFGRVETLRGDEASDGPAALLARAEAGNDAVLLVARGSDAGWDAFCRRQGDRILLVAGPETPIRGNANGCDLVLLGPMPGGDTARWLEQTEPAQHHLVYEAAYDIGAARVARRIAGRSLGLVLSGGGARGFAHIGALAAITEAGYEIDRLGGCSMGAFIAGMAALGLGSEQIRDVCHDELVRRTPFNDWTVPKVALIRSRKAGRMLERVFGELQVEELPRSLFTVSADLLSSRTVVHRRGPLLEAVGASMSIPGLVPPFVRGGQLLVDGGVLNNLPVDLMDDAHEGPVIAVDVVRRLEFEHDRGTPRLPSIMETMTRATVLGSVERAERNRALAALVISPEVQEVGLREFSALDRAIEAGRAAAEAALASGAASLRDVR
ncbi:MAG: patatin-like phospholipase family protein [Actinobacteria bacterium]|nr:patatin-like phospholipase family protein [Actinomycetota bacterium]